ADPAELFDDRQRDQLVAAVPFLGMWRDLPLRKAAHLITNDFEGRIVDADVAEYGVASFGQSGTDLQAGSGGAGRQAAPRPGAPRRALAVVEAEILEPREFALRHGDPAGELGEIFSIYGFEDQGLDLAELAAF